MEATKIPQHRHCRVCGRAIRFKQEMCSDECKAEWEKTVKRKWVWVIAYVGAAIVLVIVIMLSMGGSG